MAEEKGVPPACDFDGPPIAVAPRVRLEICPLRIDSETPGSVSGTIHFAGLNERFCAARFTFGSISNCGFRPFREQ